MTAREEWDALDAPEPVATPAPRTALRAEWDSLDAAEPNATPIPTTTDLRAEWDSLDATPQPATPTPQPTPRGQVVPGNIDLGNRPIVHNPDGSYSTLYSTSFGTDQGETLVPGIADDGSRRLSPQEAIDQYRRTGKHLGIFDTPEAADAYGEYLHNSLADKYSGIDLSKYNNYRDVPNFSNVDAGASANTPSADSAPADFYASMKARQPQDLWSVVKREAFRDPKIELMKEHPGLAAALLTGEASLPVQAGASLIGGGIERYKAGEPVLDPKAMLLDLAAPVGVNVALGAAKGVGKVLRGTTPGLDEAINDITKGWADLGDVKPTGAVPQELPAKGPARATVDFTKDVLGSPIAAGAAAKVQELKDVAKRIAAYAPARNRIRQFLDQQGREIFTEAVPGVRGTVLGQRQPIPLADREDMKLLLEGHKTAEEVAQHVVERAAKLKQVYDRFGEMGQESGLLHPGAPMVRSRYGTPEPAYSGPNIPKDPEEAARYIDDLTKLGHEGKRTVGFHERVAHKYFEPEIHDADALRGFEAYKKYAPEQFAAAYAFGAPGEYTSLAKTVEGFGKRTLAPGASVAKSTARLIEQRIPGATVAEGGTKAFGRDINELLNRASAGDLSPADRGALERMTGTLNQIYHTGERSPAAALAGKAVGTTLLPLSWLQQYGQQAWNIAKPGLQKNVEGLVRYSLDPDFRALIQASGGQGSSMEHLFNEMVGEPGALRDFARAGLARLPTGISGPLERGASRIAESPLGKGVSNLAAYLPENLVGKGIGWSESMLRGPLGAGHYVHTEDLIQRALDAAATTGTLSRGLSRELREAGINEADVLAGSPDLLSAHTLRNAGATLTGRYQLMSGDPGHSSARIIGSPWGRVAAQFKSFPLGAARLFKSDVLDPLRSGISNRDMSELALGGGRLARLVPAALGAAYAAKAGKELVRGKSPADWAFDDVPGQAASTVGGMLYDLPAAIYKGEDPTTGQWDAWEAAKNVGETLTPPIFGALRRPDPVRFGALAANALLPKLGAAGTMFLPAIEQYRKPAENPIAKLRREIEQLRKSGR